MGGGKRGCLTRDARQARPPALRHCPGEQRSEGAATVERARSRRQQPTSCRRGSVRKPRHLLQRAPRRFNQAPPPATNARAGMLIADEPSIRDVISVNAVSLIGGATGSANKTRRRSLAYVCQTDPPVGRARVVRGPTFVDGTETNQQNPHTRKETIDRNRYLGLFCVDWLVIFTFRDRDGAQARKRWSATDATVDQGPCVATAGEISSERCTLDARDRSFIVCFCVCDDAFLCLAFFSAFPRRPAAPAAPIEPPPSTAPCLKWAADWTRRPAHSARRSFVRCLLLPLFLPPANRAGRSLTPDGTALKQNDPAPTDTRPPAPQPQAKEPRQRHENLFQPR